MENKYDQYTAPQGPPPPYNQPSPQIGFATPPPTVPTTTTVVSGPPVIATQPIMTTQAMVVVGNCPACRTGILRNDFTTCGIVMAICFFPIGLLCCFLMVERRCSYCGLSFA